MITCGKIGLDGLDGLDGADAFIATVNEIDAPFSTSFSGSGLVFITVFGGKSSVAFAVSLLPTTSPASTMIFLAFSSVWPMTSGTVV